MSNSFNSNMRTFQAALPSDRRGFQNGGNNSNRGQNQRQNQGNIGGQGQYQKAKKRTAPSLNNMFHGAEAAEVAAPVAELLPDVELDIDDFGDEDEEEKEDREARERKMEREKKRKRREEHMEAEEVRPNSAAIVAAENAAPSDTTNAAAVKASLAATPATDSGFDSFDMFSSDVMALPAAVTAAASAAGAQADDHDDEEGYYVTRIGDMICNQYQVTGHLGAGVFSSVVRCVDTTGDQGSAVAVKLIRSNDTMTRAAEKEKAVLEKLNKTDPHNRRHIIRLLFAGSHVGHTVLAFEGLALNLREVLNKFGAGVGIAVGAVRRYARQLFIALTHMAKHKVIHADIKPDNILVSADYSVVKICDFGSAMLSTDPDNDPTPYLVSRFYRAPEIILGLPYGFPCDLWAIGVTLYELFCGRVMFPGSTNNDMLRRIMTVKGQFSKKTIKRHLVQFSAMGIEEKAHFTDDGEGKFVELGVDKVTGKVKVEEKTVPHVENETTRLLVKKMSGKESKQEKQDVIKLGKMLDLMLTLDCSKRPAVADLAKHEFVEESKKKEGGEGEAAAK